MLVSDSSNEDQVGKTVAIIVGVIAGLAVIIVLLSVCRKSMGKFLLKLFFKRTLITKKTVMILIDGYWWVSCMQDKEIEI